MIYFETYIITSYILCLILIRYVHKSVPIDTDEDLYSALICFGLSPLMWWYPLIVKYEVRPENFCKKLGNLLFGIKK